MQSVDKQIGAGRVDFSGYSIGMGWVGCWVQYGTAAGHGMKQP